MKIKCAAILIILLHLMIATLTSANAEEKMPERINSELTLFPGATVIKGQTKPSGSHFARLNFGNTSLLEVFTYYKSKLLENGFTIKHELANRSLIAEKSNIDAFINLESRKGKTYGMIGLEIKKNVETATVDQPAPAPVSKGEEKMDMATLLGGKTKYPQELAAIIAPFPESTIMISRNSPKGISVMLSAKGKPAEDALHFYRQGITRKGWKKEFDETQQGNTVLGFTKEKKELTATIRDAGEALIISLSLKQ